RIVETAQMVVDVMGPGGLDEDGWGLRDAQRVRLMHAAVRHLVRRSGRWNPAWGEPVNQEDMAGTLSTFSVVTLRALRKLGYTPSAREAQAYYHTWRVVGFIMGVDERLLPASLEEGECLADHIFRRVFAPSVQGREMTRVLIERLDHLVPGQAFEGLAATLIRYLVGDETAELLAVPPSDWSHSVMKPLLMLGWLVEGSECSELTARMCELFGRLLVEGLVWMGRGGGRPPFRIPDVLQEAWRVRGAEERARMREAPESLLVRTSA
ncbi:MAG TPA: oxygenase MpaB family protein, partial [Cystobacter sp.]